MRTFLLNAFRPLHLNNNINLSSVADAKIDGVGPMVGWAARATWRRLRFDVSVTESVLYASQSSRARSPTSMTSNSRKHRPVPSLPVLLALASFGCFGIRSDWNVEKSTKTVIPVTDLQLNVLVDVAEHIAVGASSFTSIWNNVTAPPAFTMTHASAGPGLEWDFEQRSLRFGSFGAMVRLRF